MSVKFTQMVAPGGTKTPRVEHDSGYCLQGLNVLGHAQLIDLSVGSECGGHGRCGKDRIRVPEPDRVHFNPPTPNEQRHLSAAELAAGWRLACQCFPSADGLDLSIEYRVR